MVTTLLFDLSRVLLLPRDKNYSGDLNPLNQHMLGKDPKYDFYLYFELNSELLDFLQSIQNKYELYMYTSGSIQNHPAMKGKLNIFRKVISAEELGISKNDKDSYIEVSKLIKKNPSEILFVDDFSKNINAAEKAGLETFHFVDNKSLIEKIDSL